MELTREMILNMPAGERLNRWVAERVMGQKMPMYIHSPHIDPTTDGAWICSPSYELGDLCIWRALPFSTDILAAWQVVEKLQAKARIDVIAYKPFDFAPDEKRYQVLVNSEICDPCDVICFNNVALAICRAALLTTI
jgi:hypothetical protein